jgi:hypothetical protein
MLSEYQLNKVLLIMRYIYTSFVAAFLFVVGMVGTASFAQIAGAATIATSAYCPQISQPVARGASGSQALEVQKFLSDYYHIAPTRIQSGYFGSVTQAYVIKYQKEQGLPAVGSVGIQTLKSIKSHCRNSVPTITSLSPSSGARGSQTTITGTNFTATGNTVKFGTNTYANLTSSNNGTSISFTVPTTGSCPNSGLGVCAAVLIQPGTYPVSVTNANGTSNSLKFTITKATEKKILSISPSSASMKVNETAALQALYDNCPAGVNCIVGPVPVQAIWTSSNPKVASVIYKDLCPAGSNCFSEQLDKLTAVVTGVSKGTATITATYLQPQGVALKTSALVTVIDTTSLTPPTITSISPTSGPQGAAITITGTGFALGGGTSDSGGMMFVNDPVAIDSQISFRNKSTGSVYNVNSPQKSSNGTTLNFILTSCPPPVINNLADSGTGTLGTGTIACAGVYIPAGEYAVTVTNVNGTSNVVSFTVTNSQVAPTLTAISPNSGVVGSVVTLTGTNFTATGNTVNFGGSVYRNLTSSNSGTTISFAIPSETHYSCLDSAPACALATALIQPGTYLLSVTNANGTSNSMKFTVEASCGLWCPPPPTTPTISSLSPTAGAAGSQLTITGTNFTTTGNTINFIGAAWSGSTFVVNSPQNSSDGKTITAEITTCPPYTGDGPRFACPGVMISPGTYIATVTNENGTSNGLPFTIAY